MASHKGKFPRGIGMGPRRIRPEKPFLSFLRRKSKEPKTINTKPIRIKSKGSFGSIEK